MTRKKAVVQAKMGTSLTAEQPTVTMRYCTWDRPAEGIVVAVLGAVPRPGVYRLPAGSTVEQAARAAGARMERGSEGFAAVTLRQPNGWDKQTPRKVLRWRNRGFRRGGWRNVTLEHEDAVVLQYRSADLDAMGVVPTGVKLA